ncbi:MAG TPA: NUDIX hydrolase [Micromonosporaceae bacterium]|nr:NUDIX hydrolase [Micromonosporaceae bacterium]
MAAVTAIRAAGGVVCRESPAGPQICLVHRPRYDDWSLPKGKLLDRETPLAAAVREVGEETGLRAAPVVSLSCVGYLSRGVPKVVDYWAMRVVASAGFTPGPEVDQVRWATPAEALSLLTYPHDAEVVDRYARLPPLAGVVVLVRHAAAGERGSWPGPDAARPLDAEGTAQAAALRHTLGLFAPERLVSAPARRCVQTLAPLAAALGLTVEVDAAFAEDTFVGEARTGDATAAGTAAPAADHTANAVAAAAGRLRACSTARSTVVCSQGAVIPPVLAALSGAGTADRYHTPKGGAWLLSFGTRGPLIAPPDRIAPAPE